MSQGNDQAELKRIPGLPEPERAALQAPQSEADPAIKEAALFGQGSSQDEFEKEAARGEHRRSEEFRNNFEKIAILFLWIISILLFLIIATWAWHLLAPIKCHWLDEDQLSKLQALLAGGVLTGVAVGHIRKRLGYQ